MLYVIQIKNFLLNMTDPPTMMDKQFGFNEIL